MPVPLTCHSCRRTLLRSQKDFFSGHVALKRLYSRPSFAPKPTLDLKHIRENPGLYKQNCVDRKYGAQAENGWRIHELSQMLALQQREAVDLRQRNNAIGKEIARHAGMGDNGQGGGTGGIGAILEEAKELKRQIASIESREREWRDEMERLALELPNLSSMKTPVGSEPVTLGFINGNVPPQISHGKSHVEIGKELELLDFEASATTSGWGWYFLKNEGALLEQALVQHALSVAMKRGWRVMTPPSITYGHIASACGFMPRDHNGETQIYDISPQQSSDSAEKPNLVLAGTAEILFAGSQANRTLQAADLPLKVLGPSRCYRAEAGARGVDTKGLYRVHEFTKVEMFAWTLPSHDPQNMDRFGGEGDELESDFESQGEQVFEEMVDIQREILISLGLHARILEMPSHDLGASAARKIDIEAFFPSRTGIDNGYGELTSASMCTDYQTRRLNTRLKTNAGSKMSWPATLNGTALAVPRVLACIMENGWREREGVMVVPPVLRKYLPGDIGAIGRKYRAKSWKGL